MNTTYLTYNQVTRDFDRSINTLSQRADISREVEYYRENIKNIDTPEQLVADRRLFQFAMRAHGLEDMTYAKAFMLKVLKEGRDDDSSFANSLSDSRYRQFAETFDFKRYGATATTFTKANEGVVENYLIQSLENQVGETDTGARLALYFRRKAPELQSYYSILADSALAEVVRTAIGLPSSVGALDIDKQVALIEKKLSLDDFSDPEKLDAFVKRFTAMWQLTDAGAATVSSPTLSLFGSQASFSTSLLLSIQKTVK